MTSIIITTLLGSEFPLHACAQGLRTDRPLVERRGRDLGQRQRLSLAVVKHLKKHVPFGHDTREAVVNALGRHMLAMARDGRFRE